VSVAAAKQSGGARTLRLVEFNLHIARLAHRSWYEQMLPERFSQNARPGSGGGIGARAEPKVSAWLLRQHDLHETFDWDMSEPAKRPWLLDPSALNHLCGLLSLAMHRQWLLRIIKGSQLRALREAAGPEDFRLVIDELASLSFHHLSPTVDLDLEPAALRSSLRDDGARTLFRLLDTTWRAVRGRAVLRFERGTIRGGEPAFATDCRDAALELICGRLIPRRLPEWVWLF
jgi:hypothetical protein